MAAIIGNRNITLGVLGGTLITACAGFGGEVFCCSPYDAATTAYLRATYPQYWQAIRNFGLDNPSLVPFINEDNDLIVSLVSVGKERWLHRTGLAYIDTGILVNAEYPFEMDSTFVPYSTARGAVMSNYDAGQVGIGYEWYNGRFIRHYFNSDILNAGNLAVGAEHTIHSEYNPQTGAVKTKLDGVDYTASRVQSGVATKPILLFTDHRITTLNCEFKQSNMRILANGIEHKYCPMTHNGENGLLDLYDLQFYPNANTSGAFTIELTDTPT